MTLEISTTYAAVIGILIALLGSFAMINRAKSGVSWGHDTGSALHRAVRSHGNIAEYAPIFLILLGLLEMSGQSASWLHGLGGAFIAGRIIYVLYFSIKQVFLMRVAAFWLTVLPILCAALLLLMN